MRLTTPGEASPPRRKTVTGETASRTRSVERCFGPVPEGRKLLIGGSRLDRGRCRPFTGRRKRRSWPVTSASSLEFSRARPEGAGDGTAEIPRSLGRTGGQCRAVAVRFSGSKRAERRETAMPTESRKRHELGHRAKPGCWSLKRWIARRLCDASRFFTASHQVGRI